MSLATFTESNPQVHVVSKNGVDRTRYPVLGRVCRANRLCPEFAHVVETNADGQVYVHYINTDKRLDEWISEDLVRPANEHEAEKAMPSTPSRKRKRASESLPPASDSEKQPAPEADIEVEQYSLAQPRELTEEEFDLQQHKQLTVKRNFDKVIFGTWQIKTWCVYIMLHVR